jgi:hypothetical protein
MDILWESLDHIYFSGDEGNSIYKMQNGTNQALNDTDVNTAEEIKIVQGWIEKLKTNIPIDR